MGLFPEDPSTYAVRHCPGRLLWFGKVKTHLESQSRSLDSRGDEVFQSAVTHASNEARSSLEIQWNPPGQAGENTLSSCTGFFNLRYISLFQPLRLSAHLSSSWQRWWNPLTLFTPTSRTLSNCDTRKWQVGEKKEARISGRGLFHLQFFPFLDQSKPRVVHRSLSSL